MTEKYMYALKDTEESALWVIMTDQWLETSPCAIQIRIPDNFYEMETEQQLKTVYNRWLSRCIEVFTDGSYADMNGRIRHLVDDSEGDNNLRYAVVEEDRMSPITLMWAYKTY